MNDKKYSTHLGIINSEKWKQLREYFNLYTFEYNNFDYSKPENEIIEYLRILYSNIDKQLKNALYYLQTNGNISDLEEDKILAYSKELNKLKFECEQKLISLNSKPLDYDLLFFDYMDLVETQKKKVLEDAKKIKQDFNNFIKIEAPEIKEPEAKESVLEPKKILFINEFDKVNEDLIYKHFYENLVDKGYLTNKELETFLIEAFNKKNIPSIKFDFKNIPNKKTIINIFYTYFMLAQKPHGKKPQYVKLLTDYFNGYEYNNTLTNFAKHYY